MKICSIKEPRYKHTNYIGGPDEKKYYRNIKNLNQIINNLQKIPITLYKKFKQLYTLYKLQNQLELSNKNIKRTDLYLYISKWINKNKI